MATLNCPGCGAVLRLTAGAAVDQCPGCGGLYENVKLTPDELFDLLAAAEDSPDKDWLAARLAEAVAEQVITELGGGHGQG